MTHRMRTGIADWNLPGACRKRAVGIESARKRNFNSLRSAAKLSFNPFAGNSWRAIAT
jgi:hypothetical protein